MLSVDYTPGSVFENRILLLYASLKNEFNLKEKYGINKRDLKPYQRKLLNVQQSKKNKPNIQEK